MNNKKEQDLISIVMPAYNAEQYIARCINSILEQTYQEFEILVVDDGSNDNTYKILKDYCVKDKRITAFTQENGGASVARNRALDNANGKYIAFIDADDFVEKDYLATLYNSIENSNTDMAICGFNKQMADKRFEKNILDSSLKLSREDVLQRIFDTNGIGGYIWNKMFKRKMVQEHSIRFNDEFRMAQDLIWLIQYCLNSQGAKYENVALYNYVFSDSSVCRSTRRERIFNKNFLTSLEAHKYAGRLIEDENNKVKRAYEGRIVSTYMRLLSNMCYGNYNDDELRREAKSYIRRHLVEFVTNKYFRVSVRIGAIVMAVSDKLYFGLVNILNRFVSLDE